LNQYKENFVIIYYKDLFVSYVEETYLLVPILYSIKMYFWILGSRLVCYFQY